MLSMEVVQFWLFTITMYETRALVMSVNVVQRLQLLVVFSLFTIIIDVNVIWTVEALFDSV